MDEQKPGNVISPISKAGSLPTQEVSLQIAREPSPTAPAATPIESVTMQPIQQAPVISETQPTSQLQNAQGFQPVQPAAETSLAQPSRTAPEEDSFVSEGFPAGSTAAYSPSVESNVAWSASEFIDHAKSVNWYLVLGIIGLVGAIGVYFWTKDVISAAAIAVVAILFGISASRKPRVLPYEITERGIQIDAKHYSYNEFKTFSIIHDGGPFSSIQLIPLKRFAPPLSMYFSPDDEVSIASALSVYLPYEERKMDATDRLLHKIRF